MKLNSKNIIIISLSIAAVIIISNILITIFENKEISNNEIENIVESDLNYIILSDKSKLNTSKYINETQEINEIKISETKLTYYQGISKLAAKIKNNGEDKENLKIKIKFLDNDNNPLYEVDTVINNIKSNKINIIDINVNKDISNSKYIKYEII